jgi:hypothetical protein
MRPRARLIRWLTWAGAAVALLLVLWIGPLAFPQLLCSAHIDSGSIRLYYDDMPQAEAQALAESVARRIDLSGFARSTGSVRCFVFQNASTYNLITRLARVPTEAQGFNLSILGNTFVNAQQVAALGLRSGGGPKYSVWEGDLAHTVAHEVAHQLMADRVGRQSIPLWKREGIPEYIANIGLIRQDPSASLLSRLGVLQNNRAWSATESWSRHGWDRTHYESWLLAEFLIEVKGYTIEDVLADSVDMEPTRVELMNWADQQLSGVVD